MDNADRSLLTDLRHALLHLHKTLLGASMKCSRARRRMCRAM